MKKALLLAAVIASTAVAPTFAKTVKPETGRPVSEIRQALKKANRRAAEIAAPEIATNYKPQTVRYQYYSSYDSTWTDMVEENYTYSSDGRIQTMETSGQKTVYTYNSDGNVVMEEVFSTYDGETKPVSVIQYTYDSVIRNYIIAESRKFYEGHDTPVYSDTYGSDITRNADGNITSIRDYFLHVDGQKIYTGDELIIEYGADGKAVKVTDQGREPNDQGQQVTRIYEQWTDIVWATTDGQITTMEYDDPDADMYFSANRVASATITDDEWPKPATFTATYDGNSYHSLIKMGDERLLEIDFKCLEKFDPREDFDDCYSYEVTSYEVDYDEEDGQYYIDYSRDRKEINTANAFGVCLLNESTTVYHYKDSDETEVESTKADVIYDSSFGYPIQVAKWTKRDSAKEYEPESLFFYADYVKTDAGVTTPEADSTDAAPEYYNLQGVRVANPDHGLYIVRQGSSVSKVLVK